jgi:hypothetical protein
MTVLLLLQMFFVGKASADSKSQPAFPQYYCRQGEDILAHTTGCMDNRVFVDEADACLSRLKAEVSGATKSMKAGFSQDATSKQRDKFSASVQDYAAASAMLAKLIVLTDQVEDEVDSYADFVNLPEDTMSDDVTGGDEEAYVQMFPCYAETRDSLDSVQDDLDKVKSELVKAKQMADSAAVNSSSNAANLNQTDSTGAQPIVSGKGQGSGVAGPKGQSSNPASDITGVKQDEQKAKSP